MSTEISPDELTPEERNRIRVDDVNYFAEGLWQVRLLSQRKQTRRKPVLRVIEGGRTDG
jgi:hypothetical protein